MEEWVMLVSNFGFPVVLSIYLLLRFEKKLDRLINLLERVYQREQYLNWEKGKERQPFD